MSNDSMTDDSTAPTKRRIGPMIARLLLGLVFFVFGLNGFLHFIPQPKELPEGVASLMGAFIKSGYMFPFVFGTQLLVGVLLLLNRFVPLALVLLAPVLLHILLFHIFLEPKGLPPGVVATLLELYLAWSYRDAFRPLLKTRTQPN